MLQAVKVEGQPERQGLADLREQATPGSAGRELPFGGGEDAFHQRPSPLERLGEVRAHLGADSVQVPNSFPASGRNHTLHPHLLADVAMVAFAVELGVGEHQADRGHVSRRLHQGRQVGTVVPRTAACALGQNELLIYIDHRQPLQPVSPGQWLLRVMVLPPDEEGADRLLRQPRRIHGHSGAPRTPATDGSQPTYRFTQHFVDFHFLQPPQKAVERRVIGDARQSQHPAQLAVLGQLHFGLSKGPVLVAHQAQHGQQLRLGELILAESSAIAGQNSGSHFEGYSHKRQEYYFGHLLSCLARKPHRHRPVDRKCAFRAFRAKDVNRAKQLL